VVTGRRQLSTNSCLTAYLIYRRLTEQSALTCRRAVDARFHSISTLVIILSVAEAAYHEDSVRRYVTSDMIGIKTGSAAAAAAAAATVPVNDHNLAER